MNFLIAYNNPKFYTHRMNNPLITIKNCRIENSKQTIIPSLTWTMNAGESWLVIGPNGGGKADFINALDGTLSIVPNVADESLYSNCFSKSTELVSLERAARLIQEERENDESEYIEGGVDVGRTGRVFITEGIIGKFKTGGTVPDSVKIDLPPQALALDREPAIKLCGIEKILDRGLKFMSTGEIRRTLLARALLSGKKLLLLSDPFAGLDIQSRAILLEFISSISSNSSTKNDSTKPTVILSMERWHEIPDAITNVLEFKNKQISFCGTRSEYEKLLQTREDDGAAERKAKKQEFESDLSKMIDIADAGEKSENVGEKLVEMYNVNVGWDDHKVLRDLTWTLNAGEHWLIQGPNGSGKTTFLELITGDNKQVYCNDVRLFGQRRGTGESIWDIKKQLGIVSYRMHVEYRMLGGTSLREVIISGFRDSIGLYGEYPSDLEIAAANKWLALGGFAGRETEGFGNLSYGEQRAILILRSAVKTPKILILDEPCHGLDEQYREKVLQLMEKIASTGTTTLLHVTHDPSEILTCEKHILELHPDQDPMYKII